MRRINPHAVLIANAIFAGVVGAVLVLAPTSGLFENLGLPVAEPEIYGAVSAALTEGK